jgi:hypothetical protein
MGSAPSQHLRHGRLLVEGSAEKLGGTALSRFHTSRQPFPYPTDAQGLQIELFDAQRINHRQGRYTNIDESSPTQHLLGYYGGGGRREGVGCGGQSQSECICNENFCCMAPQEVRSVHAWYDEEWKTSNGTTAKLKCRFGICNVTLGDRVAPGCKNVNCRGVLCQDGASECTIFSRQSCSTCDR